MRLPRINSRCALFVVAGATMAISEIAALAAKSRTLESLAEAHVSAQMEINPGITDLELYLFTTTIQMGIDSTTAERLREAQDCKLRIGVARPLMSYRDYHLAQERKYKYAAARPWQLVASDPPAPAMPSAEELERLRSEIDKFIGENG